MDILKEYEREILIAALQHYFVEIDKAWLKSSGSAWQTLNVRRDCVRNLIKQVQNG